MDVLRHHTKRATCPTDKGQMYHTYCRETFSEDSIVAHFIASSSRKSTSIVKLFVYTIVITQYFHFFLYQNYNSSGLGMAFADEGSLRSHY